MPKRDNADGIRQLDEAIWRAHRDIVKEAQANRAQFLGTMAELATRLIGIFA